MKYIKKFNEGIFDTFNKSSENYKFLKQIKKDIEDEKFKDLEYGEAGGENRDIFYECVLVNGKKIGVTLGGGEYNTPAKIVIRGINTVNTIDENDVNLKILTEIFHLLKEKYNKGVNLK